MPYVAERCHTAKLSCRASASIAPVFPSILGSNSSTECDIVAGQFFDSFGAQYSTPSWIFRLTINDKAWLGYAYVIYEDGPGSSWPDLEMAVVF